LKPTQQHILHYYCDSAALAGLLNEELLVSSPGDFDDPFEFLPDLSEMSESEDYGRWLQLAASGRLYALCLSRKANDVRMWAQYGQKHMGMMLTIDVTAVEPLNTFWEQGKIIDIEYHKTDEARPAKQDGLLREENSAQLQKWFSCKSIEWACQEETRVLISGSYLRGHPEHGRIGMFQGRMRSFLKVPTQSIRKVTLGLRASEELYSSVREIREQKSAVWEIEKLRPHPRTYTLVSASLLLEGTESEGS